MLREALLYQKLEGEKVRCNTCPRHCVLGEGRRGFCFTRQNQGGKLFSLIYGEVASLSINPVEKKPVFHFYPGSRWLSLGALGCNFRCPGCQNWELSHSRGGTANYLSPEELVSLAKRHRCLGISWTFNEPTIWLEYTIDGAKLAKEQGLYTNYVTNGYITEEALDAIGPHLDVYRVDIKGFSRGSYGRTAHIADFVPILEAAKRAKEKWGMHVELVTNLTPGYNDDEKELRGIANWICRELGAYTPWHITRFFPHLKLSHLESTPLATLERGRRIAHEEGLYYVYLGNLPGHSGENTYCHQCARLLIGRHVFDVIEYNLTEGRCRYCDTPIPGRF
ncbi:MAG: AmmeMemoRadiSam system radical SAM enzyme [Dehalococcoidia bacterium]|nr:MAG: AmmeMemoRadiSam system radical SAM enzyme [Dehalococcoidia bacterium]